MQLLKKEIAILQIYFKKYIEKYITIGYYGNK